MRIKYRQFPHPVLSDFSDDFTDSEFSSEITINRKKHYYKIEVKMNLNCEDIEDLVDNEDAVYGLHIECSTTYYRTIEISSDNILKIKIPKKRVEKNVDITTLILANKDTLVYKPNNLNPELDILTHYKYELNKGDILAVGEQFYFEAEKSVDTLKNISSIFTVTQNDLSDPSALDLDYNGDKITIYLPEETFRLYKQLKMDPNLESALASLLVTPVLTEVIKELKEQMENEYNISSAYQNKRWYRVLNEKLKEVDIDIENDGEISESANAVVQKLLDGICSRAFNDLQNLEEALY